MVRSPPPPPTEESQVAICFFRNAGTGSNWTHCPIRIYHQCEGRIEKSVPRIAVWHHEACREMTNGVPEGRSFFYPTHTRIMDSFFLLTTVFLKLPEVPEYTKMQFHMMTLLDVLGKIAWVRYFFLSQGKISDILIRCAKKWLLEGGPYGPNNIC